MDLKDERLPNSSEPIYRQIYEKYRSRILSGDLPGGTKLPSTRQISTELGVARNSVISAFNQLAAEGYVITEKGSGTYVRSSLPIDRSGQANEYSLKEGMISPWGSRVIDFGNQLSREDTNSRPTIDFGFGRSFPHIFPYEIWRRLLARYLSTDDAMLSRYGSAAGFDPLREAVAGYLQRMRGVNCTMDQVVIVSGMQQALDILSRIFLKSGDDILVESPGYTDAYNLFRTFGANLHPVPVDEHGFPVELIPPDCWPRFAFVTPSNQFPKGGTMPLSRRLALLEWAGSVNALILEDDYDGELRYSDHPIAALQGLDDQDRVIYLGTFSKVLFPALRLGYLVLPKPILPIFLKAKELVDRGAPTLTQAAVADFINEGHFERHLKRLRKVYGIRRQTLTQALDRLLPSLVEYSPVEAGLHVMLYLPLELDESELTKAALSEGVGIYPGGPYHLHQQRRPSILLGYSGLSRSEIEEGVNKLAIVIRNVLGSQ